MSCEAISKVLSLDKDTIRTWYQLYQEDGIEGLASFGRLMASTSTREAAGRSGLKPHFLPADKGVRVNIYYIAAIWLGMALLASFISIRIGVSVALVEILIGAVFGNIPGIKEHIEQTAFTTFLAGVGSLLLTFLAGAEIDPVSLKRHWKASLSIGRVVLSSWFASVFAICKRV